MLGTTYCCCLVVALVLSCMLVTPVDGGSPAEVNIHFDGSQYIEKSLLVENVNTQVLRLVIIFKTTTSSGLLLYASGTSGDYVAVELVHGKIRLVANSDGLSGNKPTIEAFHGENYADGVMRQVNVDIGEVTSLSSYESPELKHNDTKVISKAADLKFDLDQIVYYGGLPKIKPVNTNPLLLSRRNFEGCLSYASFIEKDFKSLNLSLDYFNSKDNLVTFHGKYLTGCRIEKPKFLKSLSKPTEKLSIFSHKNEKTFLAEFSYRTYLRTAVIMKSIARDKPSSISLILIENQLILTVNLTKSSSFQIIHYDNKADDGVWRKLRVEVTPHHMSLAIDKTRTRHVFKKMQYLRFPNSLIFGGFHDSKPGLVGCIKDIYLGKDLISVNEIMEIPLDKKYEESQCKMKDFCLPNNPCQNNGRCIQLPTTSTCDCKGTGYKGAYCHIKDSGKPFYKRTCSEYYALGHRDNGVYIIKPGTSMPFKVHCDMSNPSAPRTIIKTDVKNNTYVFAGKFRHDNFYFHYVKYAATKQQIFDLIASSTSCRQYFRYDCYKSTLLDSTGHSSYLGVRWYNRHDTVRGYWHGNQTTLPKGSCRCGIEGNCQSSKVRCNCDKMDDMFNFDDGYISDKNDLPITKIQVSRDKTRQESTFRLGGLECSGIWSNHIPDDISNSEGEENGVSGTLRPYSNDTTVETTKKAKNVILIDSKLLYAIIIIVVILIAVLVLILVLKRRICCCYYQTKAQPQIVEIYKDAVTPSNNNMRHNMRTTNVPMNVEDIILPMQQQGMKSSYTVSYSESSVGSIDPARYYTQDNPDSDSISMQSNLSIPKRGILKLKKDIVPPPPPRQRSDSTPQRCSTTSTSSDGSFTKRCPENKIPGTLYCKSYGDKNNYCGDKNNYSGDKAVDADNKSYVMSPLKQKVLQLSTSRQRLHSGEVFFHQDSPPSMKSSSCSSSKDSELNSDHEMNINDLSDLSELLPLNKCQRSKYVRFNEEGNNAFYKMYQRSLKTTGNHENETDILFHDDDDDNMSDKTFV